MAIEESKLKKIELEATKNQACFENILGTNHLTAKEFNSALINGFDLATWAGPLMDEPMYGTIFIIEDM